MHGDNVAAAPVSYVVTYFGQNITRGSVSVNIMTATIDLPAVDSDVNFFVTGTNVFGTGGNSDNVLMDRISKLTTYMHIGMYICTYVANVGTYVHSFYNWYIYYWPRIITIRQIKHRCCDFV